MKVQKLDFSVAILAGLVCLVLPLNIPVWAIFIGWTWYFALGANTTVFKQSIRIKKIKDNSCMKSIVPEQEMP